MSLAVQHESSMMEKSYDEQRVDAWKLVRPVIITTRPLVGDLPLPQDPPKPKNKTTKPSPPPPKSSTPTTAPTTAPTAVSSLLSSTGMTNSSKLLLPHHESSNESDEEESSIDSSSSSPPSHHTRHLLENEVKSQPLHHDDHDDDTSIEIDNDEWFPHPEHSYGDELDHDDDVSADNDNYDSDSNDGDIDNESMMQPEPEESGTGVLSTLIRFGRSLFSVVPYRYRQSPLLSQKEQQERQQQQQQQQQQVKAAPQYQTVPPANRAPVGSRQVNNQRDLFAPSKFDIVDAPATHLATEYPATPLGSITQLPSVRTYYTRLYTLSHDMFGWVG
jgi:hypothetical protein